MNNTVHTHNSDITNINNGLLPRIWGPHMWKSLHCVSFAYPYTPSIDDKKNYKMFFESVSAVLPCRACGKSYKSFIENGSTKLTDDVFESRENLTKWVYNLHEAVNAKLCVNYGVSYEDVVNKYESFRVKCEPGHPEYEGCVIAEEERRKSFCNEYKNDYPIIPLNVCICFLLLFIHCTGLFFKAGSNIFKISLFFNITALSSIIIIPSCFNPSKKPFAEICPSNGV